MWVLQVGGTQAHLIDLLHRLGRRGDQLFPTTFGFGLRGRDGIVDDISLQPRHSFFWCARIRSDRDIIWDGETLLLRRPSSGR